jgi:hypothetical protein
LRLQRFLDKASWQSHIEKEHLAESTGCKAPTCPHPKCTGSFEKPEDRDFHLHDVHCWEPRKPKSGVKRRRSCQEEEKSGESKDKPRKCRRGTVRIPRPGTFELAEQNSNSLFGESNFRLAPASTLIAVLLSRELSFLVDVYNTFDEHRSSGTLGSILPCLPAVWRWQWLFYLEYGFLECMTSWGFISPFIDELVGIIADYRHRWAVKLGRISADEESVTSIQFNHGYVWWYSIPAFDNHHY